jgi:hypothetical protein
MQISTMTMVYPCVLAAYIGQGAHAERPVQLHIMCCTFLCSSTDHGLIPCPCTVPGLP